MPDSWNYANTGEKIGKGCLFLMVGLSVVIGLLGLIEILAGRPPF